MGKTRGIKNGDSVEEKTTGIPRKENEISVERRQNPKQEKGREETGMARS